ncbi:CHAP domain-containing protein [Actinomadura sp. SCN-SB]|uniref:CHAP domain-containing protein n=1 Tax=Actinomadura sp. SCN-SB TaxID=3373092 RepID=UPI00375231DD
MAAKHRCAKGRHRTPQPLNVTLRTTGGLLAGVTLIGLAAGTARIAGADGPSARAATLAAVAPDAEVGVPHTSREDGESENGHASLVRATIMKRKAKAKRVRSMPGQSIPAEAEAEAEEHADVQRQVAAPKAPAPKAARPAPAKKRVTAADAIKLAREQVGIQEDSQGKTKFQEWYVTTKRARETARRDGGRDPKIYANAAWCSMFISWVGDKLGLSDQIGSDAWTIEHAKWFQERDRWGTRPRPGAIVFFAWNGSKNLYAIEHVGMVIKDKGHGTIETVEGNTSNAVRVRQRSTSTVVGYGYPDYAKG